MDEITPPFPPTPAETKPSRWPMAVLAAAILMIAGGAAGVAWWRFYSGETTDVAQNEAIEQEARGITQSYQEGKLAEALAQMGPVLARNDSNVEALVFAAATWAQRGQIEYREAEYGAKAIQLAEKALQIEPGNAEALRVLGFAYEIQNQWEKAIDYYNQAIAYENLRGELYAQRGHARDLSGDFAGARADYVRALELDPNAVLAAQNMGRIYLREGNLDEARRLLLKVAEQTDNQRLKAESYYNLSFVALHGDEDVSASLEWATRAVEADPAYPLAYVAQARIYILQDQRTEAAAALEKAFELYPNLTAGYEWLGIGYSKLGQNVEAIGAFNRGKDAIAQDIHLMENEREAWQGRFDVYLTTLQADEGNTAAAIESLKQAIVATRGDVIGMRLLENGFRAGQGGAFGDLVGLPEYEALAAAFGGSEPSAALLSGALPYVQQTADANVDDNQGGLIPVAQAEVINFCPHCAQGNGAGADFDAYITSLLTQFVRREISMATLTQQCQTAVQLASGGTLNCVISTDTATGVISIGCTNVLIAQYIPRSPTAVIDFPSQVCVNKPVSAHAFASSDPDGTIASYAWLLRVPPFNREFNRLITVSPSGQEVSFTPARTGQHSLALTVTDDNFLTHEAVVRFEVLEEEACGLVPPVATIRAPLAACLNSTVIVDGSGSSDADGTIAGYEWSVSNPQNADVALTTATGATTSFPANTVGSFESRLTVTDNDGQTASAVAQTVAQNQPPVAIILVDQQSEDSGQVQYTLEGGTSYDPDFASCGDTVTYSWKIQDSNGVNVTPLTGNTDPTISFVGESEEAYTVLLRVFDPSGASGSTTATLRDGAVVPSPSPSASVVPSASPSPEIRFDNGTIRETD